MTEIIDSEIDVDGNWVLRVQTGDQVITGLSIGGRAPQAIDLLPAHEVDREGCRTPEHDGPPCPASKALAHELYDAFAWVEWVSVQRVLDRFIVKAKHSYPIDIRLDLHRWLGVHAYAKKGATFELQLRELCECGEPYNVCVCLSECTDCGAVIPIEHDWCEDCLHDPARGKRERKKRAREL